MFSYKGRVMIPYIIILNFLNVHNVASLLLQFKMCTDHQTTSFHEGTAVVRTQPPPGCPFF